jgi:hypothetical protein
MQADGLRRHPILRSRQRLGSGVGLDVELVALGEAVLGAAGLGLGGHVALRTELPPSWPAIDPQGDVWAISQPLAANADEAPPAITELSPKLQRVDQSILPLAALPSGAAIDSVDDLFVSDSNGDLILQYGASGTLINYFGGMDHLPIGVVGQVERAA